MPGGFVGADLPGQITGQAALMVAAPLLRHPDLVISRADLLENLPHRLSGYGFVEGCRLHLEQARVIGGETPVKRDHTGGRSNQAAPPRTNGTNQPVLSPGVGRYIVPHPPAAVVRRNQHGNRLQALRPHGRRQPARHFEFRYQGSDSAGRLQHTPVHIPAQLTETFGLLIAQPGAFLYKKGPQLSVLLISIRA